MPFRSECAASGRVERMERVAREERVASGHSAIDTAPPAQYANPSLTR
jgi:hypothetical protein